MTARSTLAPADVRSVLLTYRDLLRSHQELVNRLNVYPVPDGDTGTNMALTLESVATELGPMGADCAMSEVCKAVSHGSLMGARGNSGVILSQLLRGIAERFSQAGSAGPVEVAEALVLASDLARQAVVKPIEGTILSVARAAGEGAATPAGEPSLLAVVESAQSAACEALARTPEQLEVLAQAGVVDAGGAGYVLLFDALLHVVDGRSLPEAPAVDPMAPGAVTVHAGDVGDLRYEVMYLLDAPDDAIDDFKEVWSAIGDSIAVVGGDGLWNCHIHTDDIGAAIEAAVDVGRPRNIRVTDLTEQVEEERWVRESASVPHDTPLRPPPTTGVVAVVTGEGVGRIFRSLGVHRQVVGGQTMNPSTAEILEAVNDCGSDQVVILPNNSNIRAVAEQVDGLSDKVVRVIPTSSIVEGFAALLAYDPAADVEANRAAMTESSQRVLPGEITRAVRDAETEAGPVREGEWLGLDKEGVVVIAQSIFGATTALLQALLDDDHELVTLIEGEGSSAADTRRISEWLHDGHPEVALEVHHGGQPLYPYLLGIE